MRDTAIETHSTTPTTTMTADADTCCDVGRELEGLGQFADARAMYERAIALEPDHAPAHVSLGRLCLLLGDFATGWREYEWRLPVERAGRASGPRPDVPRWDGFDPAGRTILVRCEAGHAESVVFARYLPLLAGRGADVVVTCPPVLLRLFGGMRNVCAVVESDPPPPVDAQIEIGSLPLMFQTTPATIPTFRAYFRPLSHLTDAWRQRLAPLRADGRRLIGLACARNSAPFEAIVSLPVDARFVSLTDCAPEELHVIDASPPLDDLAETAALLAQLDLTIAADASPIAHLAGALGKPVWTLVGFPTDWVWGLTGAHSAWYPSMRLFRQHAPGDDSAVVRDVAQALKQLSASGASLAA